MNFTPRGFSRSNSAFTSSRTIKATQPQVRKIAAPPTLGGVDAQPVDLFVLADLVREGFRVSLGEAFDVAGARVINTVDDSQDVDDTELIQLLLDLDRDELHVCRCQTGKCLRDADVDDGDGRPSRELAVVERPGAT